MLVSRKVVYLLMAISVLAAPLAACTLPGLAMSEEEKECHHMADHCGGSQMEAAHSCCTNTPPATAGTLQPTIKFAALPALPASDFTIGIELPQNLFTAAADFNGRSKSPPGQLSVLRI